MSSPSKAMMAQNPDIRLETIQMQQPGLITSECAGRKAAADSETVRQLVSYEAFLRRKAYKNASIKTGESFFDDSDMKSHYYLVIVYDKATNTPLLSSRYYFDRAVIAQFLRGDGQEEPELLHCGKKFSPFDYPDGTLFLADRLSAHVSSSIYRQHRNRILSLYYSEIAGRNKNCTLLLMVRKEKHDKQLAKYLRLGFTYMGLVWHKGKEHSVIIRDLN